METHLSTISSSIAVVSPIGLGTEKAGKSAMSTLRKECQRSVEKTSNLPFWESADNVSKVKLLNYNLPLRSMTKSLKRPTKKRLIRLSQLA